MLFIVLLPIFLRLSADACASYGKESAAVSQFVQFQRNRFFEANVRESFLRVLASARGATPSDVAADAAAKLGPWALLVAQAAKGRGYSPSFWAECGGRRVDCGSLGFESAQSFLSFDGDSSALAVRYLGGIPAFDELNCSSVSLGASFSRDGLSFDVAFPSGLYASSNSSSSPLSFGLDD